MARLYEVAGVCFLGAAISAGLSAMAGPEVASAVPSWSGATATMGAALAIIGVGAIKIIGYLVKRSKNGGNPPPVDPDGKIRPELILLQGIIEEVKGLRIAVAPMSKGIEEIRETLDIPHPYEPGFRAWSSELRKSVKKIQDGIEELKEDCAGEE